MLACLPADPPDGPPFAELLGFARSLKSKRMELEVSRIAELRGHAVRFNPHSLTDREFEVLAWLTRGATNRQIAEELFISAKTAGVHVSNILRKLDVPNRGGAAARAIDEGLVARVDATAAFIRR
jgi:DNA-binding NarL/FixJ family response regulator